MIEQEHAAEQLQEQAFAEPAPQAVCVQKLQSRLIQTGA